MADLPRDLVTGSLTTLLDEVIAGPANPRETWVVNNEPGSGVLGTLAALSAEEASRPPAPGRRTAAAHAEHLRFALDHASAWLRGETPDADWTASWAVSAVDALQWEALQGEVRRAYTELRALVEAHGAWEAPELTGAFGAAAHAAYHLGVLRQIALGARSAPAGVDPSRLPPELLVAPETEPA